MAFGGEKAEYHSEIKSTHTNPDSNRRCLALRYLKRTAFQLKMVHYIPPVVICLNETWTPNKPQDRMLCTWERKIQRRLHVLTSSLPCKNKCIVPSWEKNKFCKMFKNMFIDKNITHRPVADVLDSAVEDCRLPYNSSHVSWGDIIEEWSVGCWFSSHRAFSFTC